MSAAEGETQIPAGVAHLSQKGVLRFEGIYTMHINNGNDFDAAELERHGVAYVAAKLAHEVPLEVGAHGRALRVERAQRRVARLAKLLALAERADAADAAFRAVSDDLRRCEEEQKSEREKAEELVAFEAELRRQRVDTDALVALLPCAARRTSRT